MRGVFLSNKYCKTNKKQTVIFLRSPKHFNIGKHKLFFFNNVYNSTINPNKYLNLIPFLNHKAYIFNFISKKHNFHFPYKITSFRIKIKTKIKFRW